MNIVRENFDSIHELLSTLDKRPNNSVMSGQKSSIESGYDFTKTKSYGEATSLFQFGWLDVLDTMKKEIRMNITTNNFILTQNKIRPKNNIVGIVPHIPNAINNIPNSMIEIEKNPNKRKSIDLIYAMEGSAGIDPQTFIDAGIALLSALEIIERAGFSIKLSLAFFTGRRDNEKVFATLSLKNFNERLNIQKLTFPIAHPSMMRRIGFKWLETVPNLTERGFSVGYGTPLNELSDFNDILEDSPQKILNTIWIKRNEFDIKKIVEAILKERKELIENEEE